MGIKRIVDTAFWTDGKVDEFSPEDKYFMLYLLTNPFSTQLGIYEISIKQAAFQMGYSMDAVKVLIERFENNYGIISFAPDTNEIAIKNFLQHSIVKGGAPVRDLLIKEMRNVKSKHLIAEVFAHLQSKPIYDDKVNNTVKSLIAEYWNNSGDLRYCNEKNDTYNDTYHDTYNNENENENENDNEKEKEKEKKNTPPAPSPKQIVDLFNSICVSFPSVRSLSDARRKAIKARLNTYSLEQFKAMFEIAEASPFLKGQNNRNWRANFDWLIKDGNFAKVLDGNYSDKKTGTTYGANGIQIDQSKTDLDDLF